MLACLMRLKLVWCNARYLTKRHTHTCGLAVHSIVSAVRWDCAQVTAHCAPAGPKEHVLLLLLSH